ncbi:MAG: VWA-like domain-containing protein [Pseudomonadota bacterium]
MTSAAAHSIRATRALQKLSEADPALAALALWCQHRDADLGPLPAESRGIRITYGTAFEALGLAEQIGLCAHHILHVALRHSARAKDLELRLGPTYAPDLFGIAADVLINETLLAAGYIQPRPHVTHATLGPAAPVETPRELLGQFDAERLYMTLRGKAGAKGHRTETQERLTKAAGADGYRRDLAPEQDDGGNDADAREAQDFEWRQHLARALEAGKLAGRGIGALGFRLADIPESRTPWEQTLRNLLARALRETPQPNYRRPAGRWVATEAEARAKGRPLPVFEPARQRDSLQPRIVLGLDCSSSITGADLAHFAAQVARIGRRVMAEIHVMLFDEVVQSHRKMRGAHWSEAMSDWEFSRDGGTSFIDVIAQARALRPSALVLLTDCDGPFGDAPGRLPVIWACAEPPATLPPFGRVLTMER